MIISNDAPFNTHRVANPPKSQKRSRKTQDDHLHKEDDDKKELSVLSENTQDNGYYTMRNVLNRQTMRGN